MKERVVKIIRVLLALILIIFGLYDYPQSCQYG